MPTFRPGELSQWVSRMWKNGMPEQAITGVSQDTRLLKPGHLYIALKGEQFDGHAFLQQAFDAGAVGALVHEKNDFAAGPVLAVQDPLRGLQDMARGYRKKWTGTVVGITGSVGKTTVKEMCAAVLSVKGKTHRTAGNYNNHIGLPLTMLRMPPDSCYGVFEIGMNHAGEISELTSLLQPNIGILTDIGSAHREYFESVEEIAREKIKLAEKIPSTGTVIFDRDSPWFSLMRQNTCAKVVTISLGGVADYSGEPIGDRVLRVNGFSYTMPLPGEHMMKNALRAIALGLELQMEPEEVAEGLHQFTLPPMRWEESDVNGVHFINDAYNANPLSMRANLQTFGQLAGPGKKWAVLGGMLELGDTEEQEHRELGKFIDTLNLDGVIRVGPRAQQIDCRVGEQVFGTLDAAEAARILSEHLEPGDRVLLKASRGERIEEVLNFFKEI